MSHTPGPWRYISRNIDDKANWASRIPFAIEFAFPNAVAPIADVVANPFIEVCAQPQAEANARLIVAAPDMLETLRDIVAATRTKGSYNLGEHIQRLALSAIAKAEGK